MAELTPDVCEIVKYNDGTERAAFSNSENPHRLTVTGWRRNANGRPKARPRVFNNLDCMCGGRGIHLDSGESKWILKRRFAPWLERSGLPMETSEAWIERSVGRVQRFAGRIERSRALTRNAGVPAERFH